VQAEEQPEAQVEQKGEEAPKAEEPKNNETDIAPVVETTTETITESTTIVEAKELTDDKVLARYKAGVKRLAKKYRDEKKKMKHMREEWEKSQVNATEIARRRLELGEKANNMSDVDIMDNDKYTQVKAEIVNASIVQSTVVGVKPKDADRYTKLRTEIDKEAYGKSHKK
jgi:hypothetical protein